MNDTQLFWQQIDTLQEIAKTAGQNRLVTKEELTVLFDQINEFVGDREASNFVKICPHIKKPDLRGVTKAIRDLESHHWMYETCLNTAKDRETASRWGRHMTHEVPRYDSYPKSHNKGMQDFLSEHRIYLSPSQRGRLRLSNVSSGQSQLDLTM